MTSGWELELHYSKKSIYNAVSINWTQLGSMSTTHNPLRAVSVSCLVHVCPFFKTQLSPCVLPFIHTQMQFKVWYYLLCLTSVSIVISFVYMKQQSASANLLTGLFTCLHTHEQLPYHYIEDERRQNGLRRSLHNPAFPQHRLQVLDEKQSDH